MSAAGEKVAKPTQLGPIVSDGEVIGYQGRATGMKVGAKDFCIVAMDDYALDYLASEWLGITLDHSECRDAVFLRWANYHALLTQRDALEAREKVLVEKLAIAREFVRLRWRHLPDCPEAGSHPGAVDIQRCNCGLKFALADLGADNTNSVCSPISGEPWEKLAKGHEAVASLRGEEIERLCAREKVLREALTEYDAAFTEFDADSKASRHRMRMAVIGARAALSPGEPQS